MSVTAHNEPKLLPDQRDPSSSPAIHSRKGEWLLLLLFLFSLPFLNPWVRGDGVGYYAFARAPLIEHSLDFTKDYQSANASFRERRVDERGQPKSYLRTSTGHLENHFSVGPAILWTPFLLVAHSGVLLARALGSSVAADGFSAPYRITMALATAAYGFLSLLLGFRLARQYVEERWALLSTVSIWWASSLPVYMYFNPSWSHAPSAFATTLFLWYWNRTQLRRTAGQWSILGLIAGLMGNIYYPNVLLLMLPCVECFYMPREERHHLEHGIGALGRRVLLSAIFAVTFLLSLSPTLVTRQIVYGNPFATGYPAIRTWNWTSPALLKVLFSSDHGLWSWTPILCLAMVGLVFLTKRRALLGTASILTVVAFYYFVASYPDWDGISSYGNRFFVSLTPMFILGLAALLNAFSEWAGRTSRVVMVSGTAMGLFVLWNLGLIFQWGTHLVPARGEISWSQMARNQFSVVPTRLALGLESYFLRRQEMMNEIEQVDVEQQKGRMVNQE